MQGVLNIPAELEGVQGVLAEAFPGVIEIFERQLVSDLPPVDEMCRYIERYRGKMLRPTLVLLCGIASRDEHGAMIESGRSESLCSRAESGVRCGVRDGAHGHAGA